MRFQIYPSIRSGGGVSSGLGFVQELDAVNAMTVAELSIRIAREGFRFS
jgi:hypothetical protein